MRDRDMMFSILVGRQTYVAARLTGLPVTEALEVLYKIIT